MRTEENRRIFLLTVGCHIWYNSRRFDDCDFVRRISTLATNATAKARKPWVGRMNPNGNWKLIFETKKAFLSVESADTRKPHQTASSENFSELEIKSKPSHIYENEINYRRHC